MSPTFLGMIRFFLTPPSPYLYSTLSFYSPFSTLLVIWGGTNSCTFIRLASSPVGSQTSPSSFFSKTRKEQQPSAEATASISPPRQERSVRAAQWQLPMPQRGLILSVLQTSTAELVATAKTMQQGCWRSPSFSLFLRKSRGQNLQMRAGSPLVGSMKEGCSRKFFRQRKAQYSGRLSGLRCQMPAGRRKSSPSGEQSGRRKKVGTLSSAKMRKPFCSGLSSSSVRRQLWRLRVLRQQNSVWVRLDLTEDHTLQERSLLQLRMSSKRQSRATPCTNLSCSSSTFTWYFFSTFQMKMRLSMPADTRKRESGVHRRSSTSSVCPISRDLVDHRMIRSGRLIDRQFSRFCQIVMHLSSEPEASRAPWGEYRTTLVFLSASLSPYRIRRFLCSGRRELPSLMTSQILMQPQVPQRSSSTNFFSSEPALANSRLKG